MDIVGIFALRRIIITTFHKDRYKKWRRLLNEIKKKKKPLPVAFNSLAGSSVDMYE